MDTAFGAEGGVVSELSEYGSMRWIRCWVSTVLRGCSVEFVWCGVLGAFLRVFWRVRVCAPADLPPAQGYRIGRVEATTGHCDACSPALFFYGFSAVLWAG